MTVAFFLIYFLILCTYSIVIYPCHVVNSVRLPVWFVRFSAATAAFFQTDDFGAAGLLVKFGIRFFQQLLEVEYNDCCTLPILADPDAVCSSCCWIWSEQCFLTRIPPRVWSNVNLLETCGQRKRDREKEDNHDVPPQKTSKSSGLSAAWSFMASSKNK